MDEGNSNDGLILPEHYEVGGDVETQGIHTHFRREQTYKDEDHVECLQDTQEIEQKLWHLTKFVNLSQVQEEFPDVPWESVIRSWWS